MEGRLISGLFLLHELTPVYTAAPSLFHVRLSALKMKRNKVFDIHISFYLCRFKQKRCNTTLNPVLKD